MCVDPHSTESKAILAKGFRFYGYLYSLLAGTMLAAVPLIILFELPGVHFWSFALFTSFLFLCSICQLAFEGARRYQDETR
ncbi:MAG: hypothetical protein N2C14_16080, partial [Planctomycetales bacterium]